MPKTITHNGQKYELVPDNAVGSCARCAAKFDVIACRELGAGCGCDGGYFIKVEEKEEMR